MAGEIRIPPKLLALCLKDKKIKPLRLLSIAKFFHNHRAEIKPLLESIDIHPKTGARLINQIVSQGWGSTDGKFLFLRSWPRMGVSKRGGLYITNIKHLTDVKKFEALCFVWLLRKLKKLYQGKAQRLNNRQAQLKEPSSRYIAETLSLSQRKCDRLRRAAQRYGFITIHRQYIHLGEAKHLPQLRKNTHGPPLFQRQKEAYSALPSIITINEKNLFK